MAQSLGFIVAALEGNSIASILKRNLKGISALFVRLTSAFVGRIGRRESGSEAQRLEVREGPQHPTKSIQIPKLKVLIGVAALSSAFEGFKVGHRQWHVKRNVVENSTHERSWQI